MMNVIKLLIFLFLFSPTLFFGQSVLGSWKTIDDRDGSTKAIVNLYLENGLLFGKVEKILEKGKENATCIKCKGDRKDKPVTGMLIIDGFEKNNKGEYKGDTLFDPEQGMTFRGKIWINPNDSDKLMVRGYLAFLYRTQTWVRVNS